MCLCPTASCEFLATMLLNSVVQSARFLGNPARNAVAAPVISPDGSSVTVRVIPTDEEITIARQTLAVVEPPGGES